MDDLRSGILSGLAQSQELLNYLRTLALAHVRAVKSGEAKLRKGGFLDMRFKASRLALAKAKSELGL